MTESRYRFAFLGVLLLAALVRLESLERKPLHHDEGVNAHFLMGLAADGNWQYDPANYHGPTLYYASLPFLWILGERELALRMVPVFFGWLGIGLLWWLRDRLGNIGALVSGLLLAVSPGMVYYARDYIHETLVATFTLGVVVGLSRYLRTRGRGAWLLTAASGALLLSTKETWVVTIAVWGLALAGVIFWRAAGEAGRDGINGWIRRGWNGLERAWRRRCPSWDLAGAGLLLFGFLFVALYSSLFTHWRGVVEALWAPWQWSERTTTEHVKGFWYYGVLLVKLELPLLVAGVVGGLWGAASRDRFWLWMGAWAAGIFLAYSLIGYKTPWLILNLIVPLALLGGRAVEELMRWARGQGSRLFSTGMALLVGLALLIGQYQALTLSRRLSLTDYDDNLNRQGYLPESLFPGHQTDGYVYVQTDRGLFDLLALIEEEVKRRGEGRETPILVATPEYWPLPWYLRNYPATTYAGHLPEVSEEGTLPDAPPLLIVATSQLDTLRRVSNYRVSPTSYPLRPGVQLVLLVRNEEINQ
ncbi:MAG: flippase activity-associated protein Agl23 [Blastocatellia bacterium]